MSSVSSVYPLNVELMSDPSRFDTDAFDACVTAFCKRWNCSDDNTDPYLLVAGLLSLVYSKFFQQDSYSVAVLSDRKLEDSPYYSEVMFYSVSDALAYARCLCVFYVKGVSVEIGFKAEGAYAFFDITTLHRPHRR